MTNLQSNLADFQTDLSRLIEKTWAFESHSQYLSALVTGAESLTKKILKIGEFSFEKLSHPDLSDSEKVTHNIIQFSWIEQAKSFMILWRDILFQTQKGKILVNEEIMPESRLATLKAKSKETILAAANDLNEYFEQEFSKIEAQKNGFQKANSDWSLQQNPFPTYQKQLEKIPEQCLELLVKFEELSKTSRILNKIKNHIENTFENSKKEIAQSKAVALKGIDFIKANAEEKIGKIPPYFEDLESKIDTLPHLNVFSKTLDGLTSELENKVNVPVNVNGGLIQFKEINFQKNVRRWLESEVLPVLYEVWELTENGTNGLKMSLLNVRNRALLLSNESKEGQSKFNYEELTQAVNNYLIQNEKRTGELIELNQVIDKRLYESFGIFKVWHPTEDFLPLPLQSAINQFKIHPNKGIEGVQSLWEKWTNSIRNFRKSVQIEDALSPSEKVVRFIESRQPHLENNQYSGIFLTKGYIGESFWVGRKMEIARIETLIEQWKLGYRGAVLLSGQRHSGKSLFGDLVANRYFSKNYIRLSPNSHIKFLGRQSNTTFDLSESLAFIRKYSLPHTICVWIDDLELWSDPNVPLSKNVRTLCEYIDDYSGQIFFIVSMNGWLKNQLQKTHQLDKKFQAEINLDQMNEAEIQEAILIRHGATHKNLVNSEGVQINPKSFQKLTSKIHKSTDGNIGEALYQWSVSIEKLDEEKVIFTQKNSPDFPDFITSDSGILLATLMTEKRSNEYRLRKLFGPSFKEKYSGILQRLLNVGIITRQLDGWLEVNEVVTNEVGKLLEQKGFLKP